MIKTKIVHLVNGLDYDGTGKVVMDLCRLFDQDNYELSVISLTPNIPLSQSRYWPKNVRVYSFDYNFDTDYSLRRYLQFYLFYRITRWRSYKIIQCLKNISPDIMQCHLQPRELIIALLFKQEQKVHLLYTDHSTRLKEHLYTPIRLKMLTWIYKRILLKFHVIAVSKSVFSYHYNFELVNESNIHQLIENKIDTKLIIPGKSIEEVVNVIYVARLDRKKGHETLIKAWAKLRERSFKLNLLLVGGGEQQIENELKILVSLLKPYNAVTFVGNTENSIPYLQSAQLGVFPSLQEGLPLSLLEMMSCGLPVLVSDIDEFKGIIEDNKNGIVFQTGNPEDLHAKMELLLDDANLRKRLGAAARQLVVEKYDLSRLKQEYEKVYTTILSNY